MILGFLKTVFAFVLVLAPLVFIHELGHFLAAKLFRIGVPVFSLGFGPRLFGFRRAETDYRVSLVPLGGYVRMSGDESDEHRTGSPEEFLSRPKWQRFVVFVAGAVFNVLLAFLAFWLFFGLYGKAEIPEIHPVVFGFTEEGSAAERSGLRFGDRILEIAGQDVKQPERLSEIHLNEILLAPNRRVPLLVERDGRTLTIQLDTGYDAKEGSGNPGWLLDRPAVIADVVPGGPADTAGLRPGDTILAAGGSEPINGSALRELLQASADTFVTLTVQRGEQTLSLSVIPRSADGGGGMIGISFLFRRPLSWSRAAVESYRTNLAFSKTVFVFLKKLVSWQLSLKTMSGPIGIAEYARGAMEIGPDALLYMLGFFSLQLGILNLLPIPVLDGGHILLLGVESVMRRDLSQRLKERFMQAGLVFLLAFMAVIIYLDMWKKFQ